MAEIRVILRKSDKTLINRLYSEEYKNIPLIAMDWNGIIAIQSTCGFLFLPLENLSKVKDGSAWQCFGQKVNALHILIDCEDNEELFFWCLKNPYKAYEWQYEEQGYKEKAEKVREKKRNKEIEFMKKYNINNINGTNKSMTTNNLTSITINNNEVKL